jgi:hypothetical protein
MSNSFNSASNPAFFDRLVGGLSEAMGPVYQDYESAVDAFKENSGDPANLLNLQEASTRFSSINATTSALISQINHLLQNIANKV